MSTHEIVCPHCHKAFSLTDASYQNILEQVKTATFEKDLHDRIAAATQLVEKEAEIAQQKAEQDAAAKILKLEAELNAAKEAQKAAVVAAEATAKAEVVELKAQIANAKIAEELAVTKAVRDAKDSATSKIQDLEGKVSKTEQRESFQKEYYEAEIARLKDHRISLTTQGIGAEFEKWCENEFNKLRAGAFRNSYFERDNEVKEGGKGDYIFRENAASGVEIISIMFEMKNQADESVNTKKNTDFLEKLHKDRVKKGCEYAILVTTLEPDNDLYNSGIVEMSHIHDKMFVIRPQFFIPLIMILRNAAMNTVESKSQLAVLQAQTVDVSKFESNLAEYQRLIERNMKLATSNYGSAIKEIDAAIAKLEDVKSSLLNTERYFGHAVSKANEITVRKLTNGNPTMQKMFNEAKANAPIEGEVVDHQDED